MSPIQGGFQALSTSAARRQVLRELVFAPHRAFAIRELDRRVPADYRAVRAELQRLHEGGLLSRERAGRALRYRLDLSSRSAAAAAVVVLEEASVLQALREHLQRSGAGAGGLVIGPGCQDAYRLWSTRKIPPPPGEGLPLPEITLEIRPSPPLEPGDLLILLQAGPPEPRRGEPRHHCGRPIPPTDPGPAARIDTPPRRRKKRPRTSGLIFDD